MNLHDFKEFWKDVLLPLLVMAALVLLACIGIGFFLGWLRTHKGKFAITTPTGVIHAVEYTPGDGRVWYKTADGTTGCVSGSFTVGTE